MAVFQKAFKSSLSPLVILALLSIWPAMSLAEQLPGLPAAPPPQLIGPTTALPNHSRDLLVQASSDATQIDLTPVRLSGRASALGNMDSFKTSALYGLPARMFFNASCENSLRLETNVFQTSRHHKADMIYRVLPNVTLGYALTKRTRVATNYFFFRDQYTDKSNLLSRNVHSIGFRVDHDIPLKSGPVVTAGFFARELFITRSGPLNDLLPSLTVTKQVGNRGLIYSSVVGQLRFRNVLGNFQEADQFYSIGGVYRLPNWTLLADTSFITNFGKRRLRGGPNNQLFVISLEAGRKLHPRLPLTAFLRAEPIFNIGANQATGFAGFNFRIFGGIRAEIAKPAIFPLKLRGG